MGCPEGASCPFSHGDYLQQQLSKQKSIIRINKFVKKNEGKMSAWLQESALLGEGAFGHDRRNVVEAIGSTLGCDDERTAKEAAREDSERACKEGEAGEEGAGVQREEDPPQAKARPVQASKAPARARGSVMAAMRDLPTRTPSESPPLKRRHQDR